MIVTFSDALILVSTLFVKLNDMNGEDEAGEGRGVLREMLTDFWCQFYQSSAVGASSNGRLLQGSCYMVIAPKESFDFLYLQYLSPAAYTAKIQ